MRTDLSKFEARYKVSYPALEWPHTASWNQCRPSWCSLVASSTQGCLLEIDPKKWILRRFLAWFVEEDENENVVKKIVQSSDIQVGVGQIWIQQQSHTSIWRQAARSAVLERSANSSQKKAAHHYCTFYGGTCPDLWGSRQVEARARDR